ncbi:MAG: SSU ribosomal protein S7p (S5e) [Candidatus Ozemobacter sibiricus]|jgi:small subunit ribosomal protein S7|uniref:Small ribosomal subunit protein uS7 n=1 Tax=Candidatus Ozemobacter sibiricus TaxID=2268124 RepID=A0A367ZK31_9BACT|nr:MAG: SSU ribosomal protein S7p (S5e) [Candidatus Ozemobacter sibiricus]
MPRRGHVTKREITPDSVYNSKLVTRFINNLMSRGKRSIATNIFYDALEKLSKANGNENPLELFKKSIDAAKPIVEVRSKRIGGANYQVPVEVKPDRAIALAFRWILNFSRQRKEKSMADRLAAEFGDILKNTGATMKKRDEVHRMAEANKAFAHYRV